jgi:predicted DNA-binding WGR domain protein
VLLLARDREIRDPNILEQIQVLGKLVPDRTAEKTPSKRSVVPEKSRRHFELVDDKSSKFWEVSVDDKEVAVRFGRIGSTGQTRTKTFATRAAAKTYAEKLIAEKTGKGYQEGSPAA